ncbi:hypothetical protein [Klenkia terrae]|jgi:hypothetical protein|uniref:Acetone carboxylase n=1 Tax=Klenkia terrae TaxID=1052259 RepID=A0ABU8ECG6_9ACTN|nr:hypothetical protein [Klenkia terrae]SSC25277.1 Hypothetical protein KLENKIAIHU_3901 [Klenkia terrae]
MTATDDAAPICSAKGCRAPATSVLVWNNPKIHTPDREKTWLACDDHRESLSQHLAMRSFLRRVDPLPGHDPAAPLPSGPLGA